MGGENHKGYFEVKKLVLKASMKAFCYTKSILISEIFNSQISFLVQKRFCIHNTRTQFQNVIQVYKTI